MIVLAVLLVIVAGVIAIAHLAQLVALVMAATDLRRPERRSSAVLRDAAAGAGALPGVSVLLLGVTPAPALARAIEALREQHYPDLEIVVVLDGASGDALDALCERFDLRPADPRPRGDAPSEHVRAVFAARADDRLIVVDKRGQDRADSWNAGLNLATRPLVLPLDATDTLGPYAIADAALAFALDPTLVAAATTSRLLGVGVRSDTSAAVVAAVAEVQTMRQTLGGLGLASVDAYVGTASAPTLFSRGALARAGGFQPRSPEPDREMLFRLHTSLRAAGAPCRIARAADALVWRPAPANWSELAAAETERHYESTLWLRLYGGLLADRRFGALASLAIPSAWLDLALPIVEGLGWALLLLGLLFGALSLDVVLLFLSATLGLGLAVSLTALIVDLVGFDPVPEPSRTLHRVAMSVLEQLGPRQAALWWRLRGAIRAHRTALTA
jgi:hypothetical protein